MEHLSEHNYSKPDVIILKKDIFECHLCSVEFKHYASLYTHLKRAHKVTNFGPNNVACLEEGCNERFNRLADLELHLYKKHLKKIEKQKLTFGSMYEFQKWKKELEKETKSEYIRSGSTSSSLYFKCRKSKIHKELMSENIRQRILKEQGSKKPGTFCISRMNVRINHTNGTMSVIFCKTHYGHNTELAHESLNTIKKEK